MERGEGGRQGKIEGRGLHKQESGSSEMAESERLNLSTDGDDVCGVPVSGPAGVKGACVCICMHYCLGLYVCALNRRQR